MKLLKLIRNLFFSRTIIIEPRVKGKELSNKKESDFELGARLMKGRIAEQSSNIGFKTEKFSHVSDKNSVKESPILNKEQLDAVVEIQRPGRERYLKYIADQEEQWKLEQEERRKKELMEAKLKFSNQSLSKLPWISVNERLPSYTKEDYLNQDSLCIVLIENNCSISVEFALFNPAFKLFRKYHDYFWEDATSYGDRDILIEDDFDFYTDEDYEKVTHWIPISRQTFCEDSKCIELNTPIITWLGNEDILLKLKNVQNLTIHDLPWIPRSERLPINPSIRYLIKLKDKRICSVGYSQDLSYRWFYDNKFNYGIDEITHWFPIFQEDS